MTTPRQATSKVAFISGASSGLGEALAKLLAARGEAVVLFSRRAEQLEALVATIRSAGGQAMAVAGDVRDSAAVDAAIKQGVATFGELSEAFPCAGIAWPVPLEELSDKTWSEFVDTNLTGVFNVCRSAGLRMKASGRGSIVTIGSELALIGMGGYAAYCASKGGVVMLTKALAVELAPSVRVNCLCPGPINTPMMAYELSLAADVDAARHEAIERVPLKRFATAEEIARAAAWLAGDDAGFATGSVVSIDGGVTAL
jgi:NAD(P)-dependent dehydrogenase (short-subunit alcohol dehydrogenase family)